MKILKQDSAGNQLLGEKKDPGTAFLSVSLKLASEPRARAIGVLDAINKTLHVTRNSSRHLHIKSDSFGFCWELLNDPRFEVLFVRLKVDDAEIFNLPVSVFREKGSFLNFKQQGFELQIFLRRSELEPYKIFPL